MNPNDTTEKSEDAPKSDAFDLNLEDDTPLPPICDLNGDGTCEACQ
jgi:hypothetical protein